MPLLCVAMGVRHPGATMTVPAVTACLCLAGLGPTQLDAQAQSVTRKPVSLVMYLVVVEVHLTGRHRSCSGCPGCMLARTLGLCT